MKKLLATLLLCTFLLPAARASGADPDELETELPASKTQLRKRTSDRDLSFLTTEEMKTYQYGEISTGSLIGGGLVGTFFGLGLGHIFYGKYGEKGWIFTVGELGSLGIAAAGLTNAGVNCSLGNTSGCSGGLGVYTLGAVAFLAFRVWEIVDVWTLPSSHNANYRAIQERVEGGGRRMGFEWGLHPIVNPSADQGLRLGLGLAARF